MISYMLSLYNINTMELHNSILYGALKYSNDIIPTFVKFRIIRNLYEYVLSSTLLGETY